MLKKISTEESPEDRSTSELDALKHRDWVSLNDTDCVCFPPPPPSGEEVQQRCCVCDVRSLGRCLFAGAAVGAADEGAEAGRKAEEGAGAALQPAAHRVQPHALRDADAGHTRSQVPAAQSHGERPETRSRRVLKDIFHTFQ